MIERDCKFAQELCNPGEMEALGNKTLPCELSPPDLWAAPRRGTMSHGIQA
jgi:hypothetical protein